MKTLRELRREVFGPEPFPDCYACNGWGKTFGAEPVKCPNCKCERDFCQSLINCPICKGTGKKDAGQGQLF